MLSANKFCSTDLLILILAIVWAVIEMRLELCIIFPCKYLIELDHRGCSELQDKGNAIIATVGSQIDGRSVIILCRWKLTFNRFLMLL